MWATAQEALRMVGLSLLVALENFFFFFSKSTRPWFPNFQKKKKKKGPCATICRPLENGRMILSRWTREGEDRVQRWKKEEG